MGSLNAVWLTGQDIHNYVTKSAGRSLSVWTSSLNVVWVHRWIGMFRTELRYPTQFNINLSFTAEHWEVAVSEVSMKHCRNAIFPRKWPVFCTKPLPSGTFRFFQANFLSFSDLCSRITTDGVSWLCFLAGYAVFEYLKESPLGASVLMLNLLFSLLQQEEGGKINLWPAKSLKQGGVCESELYRHERFASKV